MCFYRQCSEVFCEKKLFLQISWEIHEICAGISYVMLQASGVVQRSFQKQPFVDVHKVYVLKNFAKFTGKPPVHLFDIWRKQNRGPECFKHVIKIWPNREQNKLHNTWTAILKTPATLPLEFRCIECRAKDKKNNIRRGRNRLAHRYINLRVPYYCETNTPREDLNARESWWQNSNSAASWTQEQKEAGIQIEEDGFKPGSILNWKIEEIF